MAVIHLDHCSCGHEYHALGRCEVCGHDPHRDPIERTPEDVARFHEDMRRIRRSHLLREEGIR